MSQMTPNCEVLRYRLLRPSFILQLRFLQLPRTSCKPEFSTSLAEHVSHSKPLSYSKSLHQPSVFSLRHDEGRNFENSSVCNIFCAVKSFLSRNFHLQDDDIESFSHSNLKDLLIKLHRISPQFARRFLRNYELKPRDVLEILTGFEFKCEKLAIEARKVAYLWGIFRQNKDFKHLPQSFNIMAKLLLRVGRLREVDFLLSTAEAGGLQLGDEISDGLIKGYVSGFQLERARYVYDKMVLRSSYPSASCYNALLNFLVYRDDDQLAIRVFKDMVFSQRLEHLEGGMLENVVKFLCRKGRIQEARSIIRKTVSLNIGASKHVLHHVAIGYCSRNEFEDILSLYLEMHSFPDSITGNKILLYICNAFGVRRADLFLQELLHLGFCPDSRTFGILIGWSCHEGDLKSAFIYISEIKSRHLIPTCRSYNALISGLFRKGMWKLVQELLHEMEDNNIKHGLSTFRVLVAGYCKGKLFEEAKEMVIEMVKLGLAPKSSLEDPLCRALQFVGLNPISVKVKRDNTIGRFQTEFADNLGNGLYLDADLDEYECRLTSILEDSMIPDFNLHLMEKCENGRIESALRTLSMIDSWGHDLSFHVVSVLVKALSAGNYQAKMTDLVTVKILDVLNHLDGETLNLVVVLFCRNGLTCKGRVVLDVLRDRKLNIKQEAYTSLIMGFCREGNSAALVECWEAARTQGWLPNLEEFGTLVTFLCEQGMLKEASKLFEVVILASSCVSASPICEVFAEKLFHTGNADISSDLVEALSEYRHGWYLNVEKEIKVLPNDYCNLIKRLCSYGRVENAVDVLNFMLTEGSIPESTSYDFVIKALCRYNSVELAMDFYAEMVARGFEPSTETRREVFDRLCVDGQSAEAERLLMDMTRRGQRPERIMYTSLIDRYRLEKNFKKVSEIVDAMIRCGHDPDFDSHWCVVSNLRDAIQNDKGRGRGFLFRILSGTATPCSNDRVN